MDDDLEAQRVSPFTSGPRVVWQKASWILNTLGQTLYTDSEQKLNPDKRQDLQNDDDDSNNELGCSRLHWEWHEARGSFGWVLSKISWSGFLLHIPKPNMTTFSISVAWVAPADTVLISSPSSSGCWTVTGWRSSRPLRFGHGRFEACVGRRALGGHTMRTRMKK
jgi:hypothetical protein